MAYWRASSLTSRARLSVISRLRAGRGRWCGIEVSEVLLELLKVYSPSGREGELEPVMKELGEKLGYEVFRRDVAGNYFFERGNGKRVILLAGHVDTVPGEVEVTYRGGVITGRGAVDAKGPFAAMLKAASSVPVPENVKVVVAGLVDEEGTGSGALSLLESGMRADHIIIGEPTGSNGIAISYRGSITVMITAKGKGGHSSAPYMGDSALEKLLNALYEIRSVFNGRSYEEVTSAVTVIKAGDWPSKLPEYAEAIVNTRFPPSVTSSSIMDRLEAICSLHGCNVSVLDSTEPYQSSLTSPVPRSLIRALLKSGTRPRIVKKTGTSDMNILFKMSRDIAAYGPGNSLLAHTSSERIHLSELELAVRVYQLAIKELSQLS